VSLPGAAVGADLGGSSKYSRGILELPGPDIVRIDRLRVLS